MRNLIILAFATWLLAVLGCISLFNIYKKKIKHDFFKNTLIDAYKWVYLLNLLISLLITIVITSLALPCKIPLLTSHFSLLLLS